jgi:hypothetical protein
MNRAIQSMMMRVTVIINTDTTINITGRYKRTLKGIHTICIISAIDMKGNKEKGSELRYRQLGKWL